MVTIPHALIVSRVLRRPELRKELVAKPKATLASRFGVNLPPGVEVRVVEDTAKRVHLVIPSEPGLRGPEPGGIGKALTRFRTDAAFRGALLKDPKAVIQAETGATLPATLDVVAVVETDAKRVIQLPPQNPDDQLQADESDSLYGGGGGGGGEGGYYEPGEAGSEMIGGCSNVDTITWSCCESDVNVTTIMQGGDCCGQTEPPDPGNPPPR